MMEVLALLRVVQQVRVPFAQVLARCHQKARRAAGRTPHDVNRRRRSQLHHQPDDVTRGTELPVLTGGGDLGQHVLVDITFGIALLHRHVVEHVHHLHQ